MLKYPINVGISRLSIKLLTGLAPVAYDLGCSALLCGIPECSEGNILWTVVTTTSTGKSVFEKTSWESQVNLCNKTLCIVAEVKFLSRVTLHLKIFLQQLSKLRANFSCYRVILQLISQVTGVKWLFSPSSSGSKCMNCIVDIKHVSCSTHFRGGPCWLCHVARLHCMLTLRV